MKNVEEIYEIRNSDPELHAIDVMMQVLERHISRDGENPNTDQNIIQGRAAMIRCAKYVLDRTQSP